MNLLSRTKFCTQLTGRVHNKPCGFSLLNMFSIVNSDALSKPTTAQTHVVGRKAVDNFFPRQGMRLLIVLTIYLTPSLSIGQTRTITGKVIEEFEMTAIPLVNIQNCDTVQIGTTDMNGNFRIELPAGTDQLLFSFIGFELTTVQVPTNCDNLEIIMMLASSYDFMTMKTVNRKRYKRFKKLNERHQEAFEKGVFKSGKPCVTYIFSKN